MSNALALRVMRDAVALQLARRGFDGLRQSALALLAELVSTFVRSLGAQLHLVQPLPGRQAVELMRQANLRALPDWRRLRATFAHKTEPMHGSAAWQVQGHKQPCLSGQPSHAISQLYVALRAAWHYKQTPAGRAQHANNAWAEAAPAASAALPLDPPGLAHAMHLNQRQRRQADGWLNGSRASELVLLPGTRIEDQAASAAPPVPASAAAPATAAAAAAAAVDTQKLKLEGPPEAAAVAGAGGVGKKRPLKEEHPQPEAMQIT